MLAFSAVRGASCSQLQHCSAFSACRLSAIFNSFSTFKATCSTWPQRCRVRHTEPHIYISTLLLVWYVLVVVNIYGTLVLQSRTRWRIVSRGCCLWLFRTGATTTYRRAWTEARTDYLAIFSVKIPCSISLLRVT